MRPRKAGSWFWLVHSRVTYLFHNTVGLGHTFPQVDWLVGQPVVREPSDLLGLDRKGPGRYHVISCLCCCLNHFNRKEKGIRSKSRVRPQRCTSHGDWGRREGRTGPRTALLQCLSSSQHRFIPFMITLKCTLKTSIIWVKLVSSGSEHSPSDQVSQEGTVWIQSTGL